MCLPAAQPALHGRDVDQCRSSDLLAGVRPGFCEHGSCARPVRDHEISQRHLLLLAAASGLVECSAPPRERVEQALFALPIQAIRNMCILAVQSMALAVAAPLGNCVLPNKFPEGFGAALQQTQKSVLRDAEHARRHGRWAVAACQATETVAAHSVNRGPVYGRPCNKSPTICPDFWNLLCTYHKATWSLWGSRQSRGSKGSIGAR